MTSVAAALNSIFAHKSSTSTHSKAKPAPAAPAKAGDLKGRKVIPFTFYVMVGAAVVGAIVAIAAGILGTIPLAVAGGVLVLIGSIGAYEVKRLAAAGTLAQVNAQSDVENEKLAESLKGANQTINDLKVENGELSQSIATYQSDIKTAQQKIADQLAQINEFTKQMDAIQKKLAQTATLDPALKTAFGDFTAASQSLQQQSDAQNAQFQDLTKVLSQWNTDLEGLGSVEGTIETNLDALIAVYAKLPPLLETLNRIIQQFSAACSNLKKQNDEQAKQDQLLSGQEASLQASLAALQKSSQDMQAQLQDKTAKLTQTEALLAQMSAQLDAVKKTQIDPAQIQQLLAAMKEVVAFEQQIMASHDVSTATKGEVQKRAKTLSEKVNAFFHSLGLIPATT